MTARILYTAHTITKAEVTLNNTTHKKNDFHFWHPSGTGGQSYGAIAECDQPRKSREEEDARDLFKKGIQQNTSMHIGSIID